MSKHGEKSTPNKTCWEIQYLFNPQGTELSQDTYRINSYMKIINKNITSSKILGCNVGNSDPIRMVITDHHLLFHITEPMYHPVYQVQVMTEPLSFQQQGCHMALYQTCLESQAIDCALNQHHPNSVPSSKTGMDSLSWPAFNKLALSGQAHITRFLIALCFI